MIDAEQLPIGTILPLWRPRELSNDWLPCNGTEIKEGLFKGKKTPNLNEKNGRFLRGGTEADAGSFQEEDINPKDLTYLDYFVYFGNCTGKFKQHQSYVFQENASGTRVSQCSYTNTLKISTDGKETRPKNMAVLFYMKVK